MNNEAMQVICERLNIMESNIQRLSSAVERIATNLATGNNGGGGRGEGGKFLSIDEQAEMFLANKIAPEALALIRTGKRDESTSRLRAEVICELYRKGLSANRIAHVLNKDHNCIFYHLAMNDMVSPKNHKQVKHRIATRNARMKRKQRLAMISQGNF